MKKKKFVKFDENIFILVFDGGIFFQLIVIYLLIDRMNKDLMFDIVCGCIYLIGKGLYQNSF